VASLTTAVPAGRASGSSERVEHSIGIAGLMVAVAPDTIRTVLGSCIGIAIYDVTAGVGGLGHVILPDSTEGTGDPRKFADSAVDMLIEDILAAGAVRTRLQAKIAGGATMFGPESGSTLGDRNAEGVRARLSQHGVPLAAESVGGSKGRKMFLSPLTGEVQVEVIGESAQVI